MLRKLTKDMKPGEKTAFIFAWWFIALAGISNIYIESNGSFIVAIAQDNPWHYRIIMLSITALVLYFPLKFGLKKVNSKILRGLAVIIFGFFTYFSCCTLYVAAVSVITMKIGTQEKTILVTAKKPIANGPGCKYELKFYGNAYHGSRPCITEEETKNIKSGQPINIYGKSSIFGMVVENVVISEGINY